MQQRLAPTMLLLATACLLLPACRPTRPPKMKLRPRTPPPTWLQEPAPTTGIFHGQWVTRNGRILYSIEHPMEGQTIVTALPDTNGVVATLTNVVCQGRTLRFEQWIPVPTTGTKPSDEPATNAAIRHDVSLQVAMNDSHLILMEMIRADTAQRTPRLLYRVREYPPPPQPPDPGDQTP